MLIFCKKKKKKKRKMGTNVQIKVSDDMLYSDFNGLSVSYSYIIQFLIILGKFHIHKSKRASLKLSSIDLLLNTNNTVLQLNNWRTTMPQKCFVFWEKFYLISLRTRKLNIGHPWLVQNLFKILTFFFCVYILVVIVIDVCCTSLV